MFFDKLATKLDACITIDANKKSKLLGNIRRVMPSLLAKDIIGVQPMTGPVGSIFSLGVRYANMHLFEDFNKSSDAILKNKFKFNIVKEKIVARKRAIKATWTIENLKTRDNTIFGNAQKTTDAKPKRNTLEDKLYRELQEEITKEIDADILSKITEIKNDIF